jgi:hypothetical protein
MQLIGHEPSNGRLAGAHETNEGDVGNLARGVHAFPLAQSGSHRTRILFARHLQLEMYFQSSWVAPASGRLIRVSRQKPLASERNPARRRI